MDQERGPKGSGLISWQSLAEVAFILKIPNKQDLKGKENIICSFGSFYSLIRSTSRVHNRQQMNAC